MSEKQTSFYTGYDRNKEISCNGHCSCPLLTEENGCVNSCASGISRYFCEDYSPPAKHEFQEGFYVLEGCGSVKIGETEFTVERGGSFYVPVNMEHSLKKSSGCEELIVFWFHSGA